MSQEVADLLESIRELLQGKIMIEYILLISLSGLPSDNLYAGSFSSCQEAFTYASENYADWKTHTCVKEVITNG